MVFIPIIVSFVVAGLSGLDFKSSGKLGLRALLYCASTTFLAVAQGLTLVLAVRPGEGLQTVSEGKTDSDEEGTFPIADSLLDLIRYLFVTIHFSLSVLWLPCGFLLSEICFFENICRNLLPENTIEACVSHVSTISL